MRRRRRNHQRLVSWVQGIGGNHLTFFYLPSFNLVSRQAEAKKGFEIKKKKRLLPRKSGPSEGRKRKDDDDEILSDDPDVEGVPGVGSDEGYPPSPEDNETAEEKRLRLAKKYLEEIEREGSPLSEVECKNSGL